MYALAASSAGVGVLALVQPAQARIVYTHHHQAIGAGLTIDLNHDGIGDFTVAPRQTYSNNYLMVASSLRANRVFGANRFSSLYPASDLRPGFRVGPNGAKFKPGGAWRWQGGGSGPAKILTFCGIYDTGHCNGAWLETFPRSGYLGLRFLIKGKVHYGWARLTRGTFPTKGWSLEGYAYETIPNKPIKAGQTKGSDDRIEAPNASVTPPAPEPATLGALALGAPARSVGRREESVNLRSQAN
jgi:hypothetical protein